MLVLFQFELQLFNYLRLNIVTFYVNEKYFKNEFLTYACNNEVQNYCNNYNSKFEDKSINLYHGIIVVCIVKQ